MAWLELHQTVRDHRKTQALADRLDLPVPYAFAHLAYLWLWAVDNADKDGLMVGANARTLARAAWWTGDADDFLAALIDTGWIDEFDNGYAIHDFYDYAGKLVERREANAERMRSARSSRATHVQNTSATRARSSKNARAEPQYTTLENTTEEKKEPPLPPKGGTPAKPEDAPRYPKAMETFWNAYDPQGRERSSRSQVFDVWSRMKPSDTLTKEIMEGLAQWTSSEKWREGFAPGAHLFLKRRLWAERPAPPTAAKPPRSNGVTALDPDEYRNGAHLRQRGRL